MQQYAALSKEVGWLPAINRTFGQLHHYFTTSLPDAMVALEKPSTHVGAVVHSSTKEYGQRKVKSPQLSDELYTFLWEQ
ncbi:hypothetical protein AHF37_06898 [Paragonimus kellicotti]|nr:hypothetical protein AHF37_06898 [Paragonimus kellicotti]